MVIPNLWFMILADTTLTRKSTAMDIAMDMVAEIDQDAILATDGSIEGLLTTLATRPGRPSVFLRDEFSGLLEQMTKKDYMAGMPELLTKLYDGKMFKRVLRKDTIEVKEPILVMFCGGIKERVTSILSFDQVSSGFMPRFVFITAESDVTKIKPLGPPTTTTTEASDTIRSELEELFKHYRQTQTLTIADSKSTIEQRKIFPARLTEDAWVRYNIFESAMLQAGLSSERPDVMTPTFDRLAKSTLKAAVLLAASIQRGDEVQVEEWHLLRAIYYAEQWRTFVKDVMSKVGKSSAEKQLDTIYNAIAKKPGITKSRIMQSYHLDSRAASAILMTLEDRGMITKKASGRGFNLYPVGYE
jgi:predicted transcriptional regulator